MPTDADDPFELLRGEVWEAKAAHETLDRLGVPRSGTDQVKYTLADRVELLVLRLRAEPTDSSAESA